MGKINIYEAAILHKLCHGSACLRSLEEPTSKGIHMTGWIREGSDENPVTKTLLVAAEVYELVMVKYSMGYAQQQKRLKVRREKTKRLSVEEVYSDAIDEGMEGQR